jgi:hypothetical protein
MCTSSRQGNAIITKVPELLDSATETRDVQLVNQISNGVDATVVLSVATVNDMEDYCMASSQLWHFLRQVGIQIACQNFRTYRLSRVRAPREEF